MTIIVSIKKLKSVMTQKLCIEHHGTSAYIMIIYKFALNVLKKK